MLINKSYHCACSSFNLCQQRSVSHFSKCIHTNENSTHVHFGGEPGSELGPRSDSAAHSRMVAEPSFRRIPTIYKLSMQLIPD